jgi:hypothetical protein
MIVQHLERMRASSTKFSSMSSAPKMKNKKEKN